MKSRVEALILNILGEQEELSPPLSRIEEILYSILNDTAYIKDPLSRIEAIVLAIKEKDEYTRNALSRIEEILKAILDGTNDYDKLPQSDIERDLIRFLGEWVTKTGENKVLFETDQSTELKQLEIVFTPKQDFKGYTKPWPKGGGKNLCKPANSGQTIGGVTFSLSGGEGKVAVRGKNSSSSNAQYSLPSQTFSSSSVSMILSGCPSGGSASKYSLVACNSSGAVIATDYGSGATISATNVPQIKTVKIVIAAGYSIPSSLYFSPMIRKSGTSNTFEPYQNICPISGRSDVQIALTGTNIWDEEWEVGDFNSSGTKIDGSLVVSKNYIPIVPGEQYTFVSPIIGGKIYAYSSKGSYSSSANVNSTSQLFNFSNAKYIKFKLPSSYGSEYGNDISINYPSNISGIHSGKNNKEYFIQFGSTVYAGVLDVLTGRLSITYKLSSVAQATSSGMWTNVSGSGTLKEFYYAGATFDDAFAGGTLLQTNISSTGYGGIVDFVMKTYSGKNRLFARASSNNGIQTSSDLAAIMPSSIQVLYRLTTSIKVNISPESVKSIVGINNLFTSDGNSEITVTYHS